MVPDLPMVVAPVAVEPSRLDRRAARRGPGDDREMRRNLRGLQEQRAAMALAPGYREKASHDAPRPTPPIRSPAKERCKGDSERGKAE